ncbi:hypothetical protein AB0K69_47095 [Streptomyces umbrinus]
MSNDNQTAVPVSSESSSQVPDPDRGPPQFPSEAPIQSPHTLSAAKVPSGFSVRVPPFAPVHVVVSSAGFSTTDSPSGSGWFQILPQAVSARAMARRTSTVRQERNTLHLHLFLQVAGAAGEIKDAFRSLAWNLNTFKSGLAEAEPNKSSRTCRNEVPQPQRPMAVDLEPDPSWPGIGRSDPEWTIHLEPDLLTPSPFLNHQSTAIGIPHPPGIARTTAAVTARRNLNH